MSVGGRANYDWDRLGLERRRGQIRLVNIPVPVERRSGRDRRGGRRGGAAVVPFDAEPRTSAVSWLGRVSAVFEQTVPPAPAAVPKVTVCEGVVATLYAAWEPTDSESHGICRCIDGVLYRQIGSNSVSPDDDEAFLAATTDYEREYRRAYDAIYAAYPELRGEGQERSGVVVVTLPN